MGLTEDLNRLDQLHDSGELSREQSDAEKSRILDACVNRIKKWPRSGGRRAITQRAIRGIVTFIELSQGSAVLWLETQIVTIERFAKPILISAGDRVLVVGTVTDEKLQAILYINESNGDESIKESRKMARKLLATGTAMMFGALAVLLTVAFAALRDPTLQSAVGIARIVIYTTSFAAALTLGSLSIIPLGAGLLQRDLHQMIDREYLKIRGLL